MRDRSVLLVELMALVGMPAVHLECKTVGCGDEMKIDKKGTEVREKDSRRSAYDGTEECRTEEPKTTPIRLWARGRRILRYYFQA